MSSRSPSPVAYYADKVATLEELFGAPVCLQGDTLRVQDAIYPIVDDVIVLLDPTEYPPSLRERFGIRGPAFPGRSPGEDVQSTFSAEWQRFPEIVPEHEREFRQYFDLVDLESLHGFRACDFGCGIGRWSYFLRRYCRELVLVDFSDAIFVARRNLRDTPTALFFLGDIVRLPFRPGFADFGICLGVLHHLPVDALQAARRLATYASALLIYLYYALDNRPWYFGTALRGVTLLRRALCRVQSPLVREAVTWMLATSVYRPLVGVGQVLAPFGMSSRVPLYEVYAGKSLRRIRQDVYDRFFTPIEQRFARAQILTLRDTFSEVVVSDNLPYWHFVCRS